jgi:hypothetical protein
VEHIMDFGRHRQLEAVGNLLDAQYLGPSLPQPRTSSDAVGRWIKRSQTHCLTVNSSGR